MYWNHTSQGAQDTVAKRFNDWEFDEFDVDDLDFDFDEFDEVGFDDEDLISDSSSSGAQSPDLIDPGAIPVEGNAPGKEPANAQVNVTLIGGSRIAANVTSGITSDVEQPEGALSSQSSLRQSSLRQSSLRQSSLRSPHPSGRSHSEGNSRSNSPTSTVNSLHHALREAGLPVPDVGQRQHHLSPPALEKARGELQQLWEQLETSPFPAINLNLPTSEQEFNSLFASIHPGEAGCVNAPPTRNFPIQPLWHGMQSVMTGIQSAGQWSVNVCTKTVQVTAIFVAAFLLVDLGYNYTNQCSRNDSCFWSGDRLSSLLQALPFGSQSAPVPTTSNTFNPFHRAVNQAMGAAELTQTASTADEWSLVANRWLSAIILMRAVPPDHERYELAQQKVEEYSENLDYAQQRLEMATRSSTQQPLEQTANVQ